MISTEQALIAAILLNEDALRPAMAEVVPDDFHDARLGAMFQGMALMRAERTPIDTFTVAARLRQWDVRGISDADLFGWTSEVTSTAHAGAHARQVRDDAVRRAMQDAARGLIDSSTKDDPGTIVANAIERLRALQQDTTSTTLRPKLLREVLADGNDDYDWVIPDLLERGDRLLLTGVEGGGKSTLVRQMALLSAAGIHPTTFFPMEPVRVLVLDAENSEKQWRRAVRPLVERAAMRGRLNPADVVRLECMPRVDLTRDSDLGQVHRAIDEYRPDVLFIGPLYRLIPRAINSDDDAAPLLAALDTLRDRGLAMVIEAHAGHAVGHGGERDLRPRGSAALLGWPEFGLGLRQDKKANASNRFQLVRWRGDRDVRKWPTHIARGMGDWPWTPVVGSN